MISDISFPSLKCPRIQFDHSLGKQYVAKYRGYTLPHDVACYVNDLQLSHKHYLLLKNCDISGLLLSGARYLSECEWSGCRVSQHQGLWVMCYEIEVLLEDGYFS